MVTRKEIVTMTMWKIIKRRDREVDVSKANQMSVLKLPTVSVINEDLYSQGFSILQINIMDVLMINVDLIYL